MVLQLITFFMMLVHFGTRLEGATKAVRLPLAPAALPGSDLTFDRLAVAMNAQGRLLVEGQALDDEAAAAWWTDQAKTRRAGLETLGEGATADLTSCRPWSFCGPIRPRRTEQSVGPWPRRRIRASPTSAWSSCGAAAQ